MGAPTERRSPMAHKPSRARPHAAFRHRSHRPMPAVRAVAQRLLRVRSPSLRAPRPLARRAPRPPPRLIRRRQRLLTLPVLVAMMGRVGWRRGPSIAEVQQVLGREGLLGMAPRHVSPQAIPKRRAVLPAAVLGQRLAAGWARLQAQVPPTVPPPGGAPVRERFSWMALVDGATREALRNKTQVLRARGAGAGRQEAGHGGGLQPPPAVAAGYGGAGRACQAGC